MPLARVAIGLPVPKLATPIQMKGGITIRAVVGESGAPVLEAGCAVGSIIERAVIEAVQRDHAAGEHLFGPELRPLPRPCGRCCAGQE